MNRYIKGILRKIDFAKPLILLGIVLLPLNAFNQSGQSKDSIKISELLQKSDYYSYNDFDSVLKYCNEIIAIAKRNNRIKDQLEAIYQIVWSASYKQRITETYDYLESAKELVNNEQYQEELEDTNSYHKACVTFAYGIYYYSLGDYDRAIDEFSQLIDLKNKPLTNDSDLINSTCNYLGVAYNTLGNLDISHQYYELGTRYLMRYNTDYRQKGLNLMYKGQYLFAIGQIEEAFSTFRNALDTLKKEKFDVARNSLKYNYLLIAGYFFKNEQYDSAIIYSQKSIELHLKNDPDFMTSYGFLGDAYFRKGKLDSAITLYEKSLKYSENTYGDNYHYTKYRPLTGIANVYRELNDFNKALGFYNKSFENLGSKFIIEGKSLSINDCSSLFFPRETMNVLIEQARLYYNWYQSSRQLNHLETAIFLLERALFVNDIGRRELFNNVTKESRAELQSRITDLGIKISFDAFQSSMQPEFLKKIFAFMEKSKANILIDRVGETRARKFSGIPDLLLQKEFRIKGELAEYQERLYQTKESEDNYLGIKYKYDDKLREYIELINTFERQYPQYYILKYGINIPTINELQELLPKKTLIINYHVGKNEIYIAALSRRQIIVKMIPKNVEFDNKLKLLIGQLNNPNIKESENNEIDFRNFADGAHYIYSKLISPIMSELKSQVKDLIIIPDGYLCYLPFEVLLTKKVNTESDYSAIPYLVYRYQIRYEYSASLVADNLKDNLSSKKNYIGFAPDYSNIGNGEGEAFKKLRLSMLYANSEEIEACRNIWNGLSLMGDPATENSFRIYSSECGILHLAAHTFLDDLNPQNSCFVFTINKKDKEDGLLNIYELYNMEIKSKLVILSSCETGSGHIKEGEGIISLARAFKYAGCPNLIMSLWKVNDLATKEIIINFNRNLKKGMHKDRALQLAKYEQIKNSRNMHPAYWGSFVLIGNAHPIRHIYRAYYLIPIILTILYLTIKLRKHTFR